MKWGDFVLGVEFVSFPCIKRGGSVRSFYVHREVTKTIHRKNNDVEH